MKNLFTCCLLIFLSITTKNIYAQNPNQVSTLLKEDLNNAVKHELFKDASYAIENIENNSLRLNVKKELATGEMLFVDAMKLKTLYNTKDTKIKFSLPNTSYGSFTFEMKEVDFFAADYKIKTASGKNLNNLYPEMKHFWGIVNDNSNSIATLSIIEDELSIFFYSEGKTYNLGKLQTSNLGYILYEENDGKLYNGNDCEVDDYDDTLNITSANSSSSVNQSTIGDKCVKMYFEVDYDAYVARGSVQNVLNYVQGLLSQVAVLYANEQINIVVQEILIWDVEDPYTGSSYEKLIAFRDRLDGDFNGDLAQLLGYGSGGGIAFVNTLCSSRNNVSFAAIKSTYAVVPNYSTSVMVVTHEIGHNLGSNHTHSCVWNGNNTAIDRCGPSIGYGASSCNEDAPIPSETGGTIMSYCHAVSGVGVNFNLGFGPQPGDLIRSRVANASCLSVCESDNGDTIDSAIVSVDIDALVCGDSFTPSVTIENQGQTDITTLEVEFNIDNTNSQSIVWTGNLSPSQSTTVQLSTINTTMGNHTFFAEILTVNNSIDDNSENNTQSISFIAQEEVEYFLDNDEDGFGNQSQSVWACDPPSGYVLNNNDCDDSDSLIYPSAPCDDGDDCTINDVLDEDCNCVGTFADEDEDTVCDYYDTCYGFDDTIDLNSNGIPDGCEEEEVTIVHEGFFETGLDGWIDGGGDCTRYLNQNYAFENSYSVRLRDDSDIKSSMRLENIDISSFDEVSIDFYFYSRSMEYSEDFLVYLKVGNDWEEVASFASGNDFDDFTFNHVTITLSNQDFSFLTNSGFKIECSASTNGDQVFIDQVTIAGKTGGDSNTSVNIQSLQSFEQGVNFIDNAVPLWMENENASDADDKEGEGFLNIEMAVYPNPASDFVYVNIDKLDSSRQMTTYTITNSFGQTVQMGEILSRETRIELGNLNNGIYSISIISDNLKKTSNFTVFK